MDEIMKKQNEMPGIVYGRLLESVHLTGYSLERACSELEWLLEEDRWKNLGGKTFGNINEFLDTINLSEFKFAVEQRKKIAKKLTDLQATQRAAAKVLGVTQPTVHRDLGLDTNVSKQEPEAAPTEGFSNTDDTNVSPPPSITASGAEAAEVVKKEAQKQIKRQEALSKVEEIKKQKAKPLHGTYEVIVIDPPWPMKKIERDCRPNQHEMDYPTMTEDELKALNIPCAENCHIFLWTTHKFLPMALRLLDEWGFKYVCTFVWHKPGGFQPVGLPQYNCEFVLYARKGSPVFSDTKAFNLCFMAERGMHSEKPEFFYEKIKRATGDNYSRLDMFSRRKIDGFESWGNQI